MSVQRRLPNVTMCPDLALNLTMLQMGEMRSHEAAATVHAYILGLVFMVYRLSTMIT